MSQTLQKPLHTGLPPSPSRGGSPPRAVPDVIQQLERVQWDNAHISKVRGEQIVMLVRLCYTAEWG